MKLRPRLLALVFLTISLALMAPGIWIVALKAQGAHVETSPEFSVFLALFTLGAFSGAIQSLIVLFRGH